MKPDLLDDIVKFLPEQHHTEFWRVMARFRQLRPDDEILLIFQAMGVLTFILRDLPTALIQERTDWQKQLETFSHQFEELAETTEQHALVVSNQAQALNESIEKHALLFRESSQQLAQVSSEAVKKVDLDQLTERVTAHVEEKLVTKWDKITDRLELKMEQEDKLLSLADKTITLWRKVNFWPLLGGISFGIFIVCLAIFLYGLKSIEAANQIALETKLEQIQALAETNKEAFSELARYQIKVDVVDVSVQGQKQWGQKALRLSPALTTGMLTDPPQTGGIIFAVPMTSLEKFEQQLHPDGT